MNCRSVRRAVFVQDADGLAIAFELEVRARVVRALRRRARPDFKQQHVSVRAVHDAVAVRHVRLPARAVARFQYRPALVLNQHALALQDVDELILLLVPVTNRRRGTRLELRQVHAELREAHSIAERGLVASRTRGLERGRIIWRADPSFELADVDLRHRTASYTRSIIVAVPIPAPMHSVTSAVLRLRRSSSSSTVPKIIAPVAPSG